MARKEPRKVGPAVPAEQAEGQMEQGLALRRGFLVADKLWQPGTDVAAVNRLMKSPDFRGLYETGHFVPQSLRRKKLQPLLPTGKDDPRLDLFADWFLGTFQEATGCAEGSSHPAVEAFFQSYTGGPNNAYLRGQTFALSAPDMEYWEGYGLRKGQAVPHAWNRLNGSVLDLTWHHGRANPDTIYLGVPVAANFLHWCQASGGPVAFLYWAKQQYDGVGKGEGHSSPSPLSRGG